MCVCVCLVTRAHTIELLLILAALVLVSFLHCAAACDRTQCIVVIGDCWSVCDVNGLTISNG